jgi:hypothetical protein
MTKLPITSQCVIAMTFLVINLEKGLRTFIFHTVPNYPILTLYTLARARI